MSFKYLFNSTDEEDSATTHFQKVLVGANNTKSFMHEYCKKKILNDIAIVELVMESPTLIKYIQTYKASLTDRLANFGMHFTMIVTFNDRKTSKIPISWIS